MQVILVCIKFLLGTKGVFIKKLLRAGRTDEKRECLKILRCENREGGV